MVHGLFTDLPKFKDVRFKLTRHKSKRFPVLSVNILTHIIVHHSLTRRGLGGSNAESYARFHVNSHNWPGIGYSYVIEPDGTIKFANEIHHRTYHVGNSNNFSVGIVLTGDFRHEEPTEAQKESLRILVERLQKDYPQLKTIRSHHEMPGYSWKACCEFNYKKVLSQKASADKVTSIGSKYTVQEGDTFWSIAKGRSFDVVDLEVANKGVDPRSLKIGQVINIPGKSSGASSSDKSSTKYHGNSIVKYLESIGENSSYSRRASLAKSFGINGYRGTAKQNVQLLNILRDGKRPPTASTGKKSVNQMAKEVREGKHGTGHTNRRKSLGISEAEYAKVRAEVNRQEGLSTPSKSTVRKGSTVTARRLYATSSSTKNVRSSNITGYVDTINNGWRNEIRLRNKRGGHYIGFTRKQDLV